MNPLNYGSREACQQLVDAGIVLETECCWQWKDPCSPDDMAYGAYGEWILVHRSIDHPDAECLPALSMAEAWRELPDRYQRAFLTIQKVGTYSEAGYEYVNAGNVLKSFENINPTDALIYLLIWLKGHAAQEGAEGRDERNQTSDLVS